MKIIKKLFLVALSAGLLSVPSQLEKVEAADTTVSDLNALVTKYYNKGVYTKKTTINITDEARNDILENGGFHNKASDLVRTTYFDGNELWMTNDAGVNSGYGTNEQGDMTHFSKINGENVIDYTVPVEGGMEGFYLTLKDFVATDEQTWDVENGVFSTSNQEVIGWFKAICAPCYVGFEGATGNYITLSKVEIEEVDKTLELRLYASEGDTKKLNNSELLFAKADIYRGVFSINIGTNNFRLDINDNSTDEWALAEYMILGANVNAGDTFELVKYGIEKLAINKYEGNLSSATFKYTNEQSDIYVKFYDGAIDVWASTPEIEPQIAKIYFTMPGWSGNYQAPSIYYWGGQGNNWDETSKTSNMILSSGNGGWNSTYYIDIDLTKGSITGIIVKFKQNGTLKQSNDITTNLPTTAGEYVITAGYKSWSGDKWSGATIAKK